VIGEIQVDIETMPRGGFDASWLDRRLQTDRLEYLDRDGDDRITRQVIGSLDWMERIFREHDYQAERTLTLVADIPDPKILELGAGHGGLSRKLLEMHPTVHVTVTDIDPIWVSNIASGDLGSHPRAVVRHMDASNIDAPDRSYDLALFVLSFHHLPPAQAARVLAEGTRAANKLLIIDLRRPPALLHLILLAAWFPISLVWPVAHDGLISSLRAYSPSAFRALAAHADPTITVEFSRLKGDQVVVAQRWRPSPSGST
jgi:SAM-dependent methyltransferase